MMGYDLGSKLIYHMERNTEYIENGRFFFGKMRVWRQMLMLA